MNDEVSREETESMTTTQALDTQQSRAHAEGITVIGEALRRVAPDHAEFLVEITANAPTAAQALRDNQAKTAQVAQAVSVQGVAASDIQTISLNVLNLYAPMMPSLPGYAGMPQLGQAFQQGAFQPGSFQPEVQFGSYQARNTLRVSVRDAARVGEIVDTAARAGATSVSPLCFKAQDEQNARKGVLEVAGKDARAKAEALAVAAGRKIGEAISISEDIVASNGAYAALRSAFPLAFGAGAPRMTGELEYYARVTASFRFM
jgi:uncharacterized protein YggE